MTQALNNRGASRLIRAIQAPLLERLTNLPPVLELGVVLDDFGIKLNGLSTPVPVGAYLLARYLTLENPMTQTESDGQHSHGPSGSHGGHTGGDGSHSHTNEAAHVHDVERPSQLDPIAPGDTVLCGWTRDGADLVVLCVVVRS